MLIVMIKNHDEDKQDNKTKIDSIAEQWVNLVLSHIRAKRLPKKEPIKINSKYEYATQ